MTVMLRRIAGLLAAVLVTDIAFAASPAALRLPAVFGNHMVLQREMPAPVWGWAAPGEAVTVTLGGQSASIKAGDDGRWSLKLPALPAGGPHELNVQAGTQQVKFIDVLVGEVWLCSGQSNMDFAMNMTTDGQAAIASARHPRIRLLKVAATSAEQPKDDIGGQWALCQPGTASGFSAVAYFFGRAIQEKLDVPIGLICGSLSGSPAEKWISREAMQAVASLRPLMGNDGGRGGPRQPNVLYNGVIAPLIPYAIRGVIWYQGENNSRGDQPLQYATLLSTLIGDWRGRWDQGDFPFLIVQLPNFDFTPPSDLPGSSNWALVREAQLKTLALPATGLAVTIDIGQPDDIHPRVKKPFGDRLALLARHVAYKEDIACTGPLYKSAQFADGRAVIRFGYVGGSLSAGKPQANATEPAEPLRGFAIAGQDRKFVWANAKIEGDTVVVWSESVPQPVAVRYAWADNPACNLYNSAALPASPFRTDDWPALAQGR